MKAINLNVMLNLSAIFIIGVFVFLLQLVICNSFQDLFVWFLWCLLLRIWSKGSF